MLTLSLILEPLWSTTRSVCNIYHIKEKEVFFLNTLKISLAPTSPRMTISGDVCANSAAKKQKELDPRWRVGQDATKKMCGSAESCIQFPLSIMPMSALTWMVKNIPNQTTIEDFTEEINEAEFDREYNFFHLLMRMLCLCLALMNFLQSLALPASSLVTMAV